MLRLPRYSHFVANVPRTHEPSRTADGVVLKVSCSRMFLVWLRGALLLGMCSRQLWASHKLAKSALLRWLVHTLLGLTFQHKASSVLCRQLIFESLVKRLVVLCYCWWCLVVMACVVKVTAPESLNTSGLDGPRQCVGGGGAFAPCPV